MDMNRKPDVSFIIPVYNMADTLSDALESLFRIDGLTFEIVMVDDGSAIPVTDTVGNISDMPGAGVQIIRTENRGRALAINEGLRHVSGRYVSFVDADDFIDPGEFSAFKPLIKDGEADLIIGQFKIIGEHGKVFDERVHANNPSAEDLIQRIAYFPLAPVHLNAMIIKKSLIDKVGLFDGDNLKSEDKDMTIRLLREAGSVRFCNTFHYHYHKHDIGRGEKLRKRLEWIRYRQRMISRNFSGGEKITSKILQFFYDGAKLVYELAVGYRKR